MERSVNPETKDSDPFDLIIFELSPRLGGRSEVLECDMSEAMNLLNMEMKEREQKRFINFIDLHYGANSKADPKAKKRHLETVKPKQERRSLLDNPDRMKWEHEK